jgi:aminocarboxymuconate-semialdehyde decarboxylase
MAATQEDIVISPVETEKDLYQANHCISEAFGRQTKDAVWQAMNPGWDTEVGQALNAQSMIKRWKTTTTNKDGKPNTIFLKATVPDPDKQGERRVVGMAIWAQLSNVEGYGDKFTGDMSEALAGVSGADRRFAEQMFKCLWKRRIEYIREVSESDRNPAAIFVLDLCAVDPAFQRRGIAGKLVEVGLEEAKQRGNLECTTEGSAMGRAVYRKLGFKDEGLGDIVWEVEEEFQARDKPPNVFLRTGA